jgi:putative oxidoreductase
MRALYEKLVSLLSPLKGSPALAARLVVGWVFIISGWGKLHHLEKVVEYFQSLGIPAAGLQAPFVACVEFIGGLALVAGLGTRLASLMLSGTMVVALITAKKDEITGLTDLFGLAEFLYLVFFFWLIVEGAGRFSVDAKLTGRRR